jgi:hypothetical protein
MEQNSIRQLGRTGNDRMEQPEHTGQSQDTLVPSVTGTAEMNAYDIADDLVFDRRVDDGHKAVEEADGFVLQFDQGGTAMSFLRCD